MNFATFFTGLGMSLSLIVAIGAQNAFILRQGLRNEHVFAVCLACALSDALLILLGVFGLQQILHLVPWLDPAMRYGGAAFLVLYGAKSLWSALKSSGALRAEEVAPASLMQTLMTLMALTFLNPHVYLDTVVFLGTVSTRFQGEQAWFAAGAMTGSLIFFFSLGYGARLLGPLFARPMAWRCLETAIACVMWAIAFTLVRAA